MWIKSLEQMLPRFLKAAFISPVLSSDLLAHKDSTKYLIMVNDILATGDS